MSNNLSYSINYVIGSSSYQAEITKNDHLVAFIDFFDEEPNKPKEIFFHPDFQGVLQLQEFLEVIKKIENEFDQITKKRKSN